MSDTHAGVKHSSDESVCALTYSSLTTKSPGAQLAAKVARREITQQTIASKLLAHVDKVCLLK